MTCFPCRRDSSSIHRLSEFVRRDGVVLEPGVDYRFDYQPTTDTILLSPQAGVWLSGFTYEVELVNQDRTVVAPGNSVDDGVLFTVADPDGVIRTFEFETGVNLRVPQTLTLVVPAGTSGLSAVSDREIFTISNGLRLVTFEFDSDNAVGSGRVAVPFTPASTPDDVAQAIVDAIASADLGLAPVALGDGQVHVGGLNTTLDTTVTALQQFGAAGIFVDGQTLLLEDGTTSVRFEFDDNGEVTGTNFPIPFDANGTQVELAAALRDAINDSPLSFTAVLGPTGEVNLGSGFGTQVDLESSNLIRQGFAGTNNPSALPIAFRPTVDQTQADIATLMETAIDGAAGLSGLRTFLDEEGRLVILNATSFDGLPFTVTPAIRDTAGNLLRTNQDEEPFSTLLTVDLPAPLDFGDAPDPSYRTSLNNNGARHVVVPNIHLGQVNSAELDGQANDASDDGVTLGNVLAPGGSTPIFVAASTVGFLDAWVDVDADGRFDDPRDRVFDSTLLNRGVNELRLALPDDAAVGDTYARFRFSTGGELGPIGRGNDGEVEDYIVSIRDVSRPVATNDNYSVNEDDVLVIPDSSGLLTNDQPSDLNSQLTSVLAVPPTNGTVTLQPNGAFVYQPDPDFAGTDTFSYRADGTILGSNLAVVTITVNPQPDAPIARDDPAATNEDTPVVINLVANDEDPDGFLVRSSITIQDGPSNGVVTLDGNGAADYVPNPDFFGTDSFTYTIRDGENAVSDVATVTIEVRPTNDVPIANSDAIFVRQGGSTTVDLLANDVDVDGTINRQSLVITQAPKSGTILFNQDGTVTFRPDLTFLGVDSFRYTIRDNDNATSNQATVSIQVSTENLTPTAADDLADTLSGQAVTVDLVANDSDADGSIVPGTVEIVQPPTNGEVTVNVDGTAEYVPTIGFTGTDVFRYQVRDDLNDLSNIATVTVTVQASGAPWQNPRNPLDVDDNGVVIPSDALAVINELTARGIRALDPPPLATPPFEPPPYIDVDGNDFLSPIDALLVINFLNFGITPGEDAPAAVAATSLAGPSEEIVAAALHIAPRTQADKERAIDEVVESVGSEELDRATDVAWVELPTSDDGLVPEVGDSADEAWDDLVDVLSAEEDRPRV